MLRFSLTLALLVPLAALAGDPAPARSILEDPALVSGLGARNIGSAVMSGRIALPVIFRV